MYSPKEFSKMLGVSVKTLQRWDAKKILVAFRTPLNRRYYTHEQYLNYINYTHAHEKKVVYFRVSSASQKEDLINQRKALEVFCSTRGYVISEWISEIGSGLNFKRKHFNQLFEQIEKGEISTLIIAHKDRLVRFGFDWFNEFAIKHGCKIEVMNQESLSP